MTTQTTDLTAGLAHDVTGDGPPLLLVHGLGSSSRAFAPVAPALAERFRTYAVDLPGHGRSPLADDHGADIAPERLAADVGRWMDELGLERAHLVGNSMGGWVALELAADGRALSVTALAPAGLWEPTGLRSPLMDLHRGLARLTAPVAPVLARSSLARGLGFRHTVERPDMLTSDVARAAVLDLAAADGYDAAHAGMVHRSFDRPDEVPADVPVTIVFGDRDRVVPAATGWERDHAPAHARWVVLERCGHVPMWDCPDETVEIVRATAGG